jgi:protein-S-isoprenylcysteine O-methyltransferase Ste14
MRQGAESGGPNDVANFGLVRPPVVYLTSILVGLALDLVSPLPFLPDAISVLLGIVVIGGAIALFVYAVTMFQNAGTPVQGNLPTSAIVRDGPYRYSRNPIYVAFSLLQLGIAICVNSLWVVVTGVVAIALMAFVVIPREERYLERRFGREYREYQASVRRWV